MALALVNHDGPAPAGQGRGTSKHRSEHIASCGVGARTLKQAALSAQRGKVEQLSALVEEVPDVLERPAFAARVLQDATLAGRGNVVQWLIGRGVDVNRPAPLPVSLAGASFELVFFVTPLCAARMTRRSEMSTYLLGQGARADIFTAAFLGDLPLLRQLLAERPSLAQVADPATDVLTITPVHHAVGGGQLPALRILLDHAAEPVRTGSRALRAAAARGNRDIIEPLLEHGADDPAFVAALLRCGARVDQRYNGATPLHYVVKAGFAQTIQVLLEHGADREALDNRGRTPSHWLEQAAESVDRAAVRDALRTHPHPR